MTEELDTDIRQGIIDRLEGWELVEFLQIPTEDITYLCEEYILEHLDDVIEFCDLRETNNNE